MKPIAQSVEVARELDRYVGDGGVLAHLESVGGEVQRVVPQCIGLSLAWTEHGVTFTVVASDDEIGITTTQDSLFSEDPWLLFAQSSAAHGVRSTLTMPLTEEGQVVGSVNLYAGTADAFDGHHDELASVLGAWAPGAVRNSDLTFSTRHLAEGAPQQVRGEIAVAKAVGILAVHQGVEMTVAQDRLEHAAARAGVTPGQLALALVNLGNDAAQ